MISTVCKLISTLEGIPGLARVTFKVLRSNKYNLFLPSLALSAKVGVAVQVYIA